MIKLKELYSRYVKLVKNKRQKADRKKESKVEFLMAISKRFGAAHANYNKDQV